MIPGSTVVSKPNYDHNLTAYQGISSCPWYWWVKDNLGMLKQSGKKEVSSQDTQQKKKKTLWQQKVFLT